MLKYHASAFSQKASKNQNSRLLKVGQRDLYVTHDFRNQGIPNGPQLLLTFGFTMISMSIAFCSCNLLTAAREIQRLFVLNILNLDTDLNSSTWAFGT